MKFLCKIYCDYIRPLWSRIRWAKENRGNSSPIERVHSILDIKQLVKTLNKSFCYTMDDISEAFDSLKPPSMVYQSYVDGKFKDDCDGFHTCVYHILANSKVECWLLTLITKDIMTSHTVLLFEFENKWYIDDYDYVHGGLDSVEEMVETYKNIFVKNYRTKPVIYINFLKYDYVKGTFYNVKESEVK